ncbi:MAG: DnaD domain protein [Clostridiales bacterium]|nr:DnaD domain protein [Clostridiales bacterium]
MIYNFVHSGEMWNGGFFAVPAQIIEKYIKLASEYELKALLIVLKNGGAAELADIAKPLGITQEAAADIMDFWINEGCIDAQGGNLQKAEAKSPAAAHEVQSAPKAETLKPQSTGSVPAHAPAAPISCPRLSQAEIVMAAQQNPDIEMLLNEAQVVLGRTLRTSEQEMLVNLISFYGLSAEVVLVILQYYRNEKEKGRAIGMGYVMRIAQNWADEGIDTAAAAEEKCKEIEHTDSFWRKVASLAGISFKAPTAKQREKVLLWQKSFSIEMVEAAVDIMKNNCARPSFSYIDAVLSNWLKKGISTPEDVQREAQEHKKSRAGAKTPGVAKRKATYDIDKIQQDAKNITEFKLN